MSDAFLVSQPSANNAEGWGTESCGGRLQSGPEQAAEKVRGSEKSCEIHPSAAKAGLNRIDLSARVNSCPFKTALERSFSAVCEGLGSLRIERPADRKVTSGEGLRSRRWMPASEEEPTRLKSIEMSDTLYLSLWFPNLRLAALPDKLTAVLGGFAAHGGDARVYSATVWPVGWSESPIFQHVYGRGDRGAEPRQAVETAMELLHDDYAYEFQIGWDLWELEIAPHVDPRWAREPRLVRVTGFGPLFDEGTYEQDGHIRIDFGDDAAFVEVDADLDAFAARHVEENVRQLVELTLALEKASGATARVLWSELGESLAQRLAARLGMGN